jgi:hypothetical protein
MILSQGVCAVVLAIASAQKESWDRSSESALIGRRQNCAKAILTRDEATLRKRLVDDFVIVHNTGGSPQTREALRGQASIAVAGTKMTRYDRSIRLVGTDITLINETVNL